MGGFGGVYQKLLLSLNSHGWQKRPLKRLSHPFFYHVYLSLSPSLSIFLSPSARPKGFCQIELNQCGPCGPHSQPVCARVCVCGVSAALAQKRAHNHKVLKK